MIFDKKNIKHGVNCEFFPKKDQSFQVQLEKNEIAFIVSGVLELNRSNPYFLAITCWKTNNQDNIFLDRLITNLIDFIHPELTQISCVMIKHAEIPENYMEKIIKEKLELIKNKFFHCKVQQCAYNAFTVDFRGNITKTTLSPSPTPPVKKQTLADKISAFPSMLKFMK